MKKTITREEVIEALVEAYVENSDIYEIAREGVASHKGYEKMSNDELETDYEYHFGEKLKVVE